MIMKLAIRLNSLVFSKAKEHTMSSTNVKSPWFAKLEMTCWVVTKLLPYSTNNKTPKTLSGLFWFFTSPMIVAINNAITK
ncbi:hypothetical protein VCHA34P112_300003 [Vibrio chagasii]|nr:hypothetical protein VCHA34P112_300003 [Vibrio chagasii]CAH7150567.1 hypothetical protein VCHA56P515_270003 [Vibrio chagasii]CAH7215909.1 hypothetical protein VCHA53O463_280069 [Vibrio chagasii]